MTAIGVGIIGASPGTGWAAAAHVPALQALPQYMLRAVATSRAGSARLASAVWNVDAFDDAVRLHRLVDRIARGASTTGAKMTADLEETPCALQS
ncbi:hypothetical protein [Mycolicibacterium chlorophenolicum]|uniref:Uncharacterized protein n=1 Tax=Mycolicibacterium chlorophenolicum TaxID=37916 RepID=A0A0J6VLP4_9MYCO|nr:hypothetical protein [Mycolicibacterium chlorophenolicum]KMO70462.1 hypothetical protein MCHLDSM_05350 [Mycolicibacterium chlorophenolicum]